jgi:hypothetical protein
MPDRRQPAPADWPQPVQGCSAIPAAAGGARAEAEPVPTPPRALTQAAAEVEAVPASAVVEAVPVAVGVEEATAVAVVE